MRGKGIYESCIASDNKGYHPFEKINSDVDPGKSQKNPTTKNTAVISLHDGKKRNSKDIHNIAPTERIRVLVGVKP
ncbi:MAG TPA: hypothetical protein VER14_01300 [Phototrophicaceae bacterium]|nr:hypothetical protein [Phototrophicaceae bacterium]